MLNIKTATGFNDVLDGKVKTDSGAFAEIEQKMQKQPDGTLQAIWEPPDTPNPPPDGWNPDNEDDIVDFVSMCDAMADLYDPTKQPPAVLWEQLQPWAEDKANHLDTLRAQGYQVFWWSVAQHHDIPIWTSNQSILPTCVGWATTQAYKAVSLYQKMMHPLSYVDINPIALWLVAKSWHWWGGASIYHLMNQGMVVGNFPVADVGEHNALVQPPPTHWSINGGHPQGTLATQEVQDIVNAARPSAALHQFGACVLSGSQNTGTVHSAALAERIMLCCRAGLAVVIGNYHAVRSRTTDSNNMRVGIISGMWSHATTIDAYVKVNGTEYVHVTNSHGNIYGSGDRFGAPVYGFWLDMPRLIAYCAPSPTNNLLRPNAYAIYRVETPVRDWDGIVPATVKIGE